MPRLPLKDVKVGMSCRNVYLLKSHYVKVTKSGKKYLDLIIRDAETSLPGKWWDPPEDITQDDYVDSDFIVADFTVEDYNGKPQARINGLRKVLPNDVFDKRELIPHSQYSSVAMYNELYDTASAFQNESLKKLVHMILENNKEKLMTIPAARTLHHDYLGGLLEHTCEVLRTAKVLSEVYPCHKELLFAGAIVHDIAKIVEFEQGPTGLVSDYSARGKLIGHVTLGMSYIESICQKLDINGELKYLMQHMVLSHHGLPEYGSPVHPMFIEAMLLHECDVLSAKSKEFNDATGKLEPGTWSDRIFGLENVQVYRFKEEVLRDLGEFPDVIQDTNFPEDGNPFL